MGYSNTTNLALRKDDGNESIVDWRTHNNTNLDTIDQTVGNLVKAINNAKVLLGQLGYDQNGDPIVNAATARSNLDAAQSENAAGSLYDAEQAIGVNAGNIATNASAISSLRDSVGDVLFSISKANSYENVFQVNLDYTNGNNNIIAFVYQKEQKQLLATLKANGVWLPNRVIADWN